MINIYLYKRPEYYQVQWVTPKYLALQDFIMENDIEIGYNIIQHNQLCTPQENIILFNAHLRTLPITFQKAVWIISPYALSIEIPVVDPYEDDGDE